MVSLMHEITMANTLNPMVAQSAEVLHAQEVINQHLYQAIHILQQQTDLLAEELTLIRDMSLVNCDPQYKIMSHPIPGF